MSCEIRVLPRAKSDFWAIHGYIAKRSLEGAGRWRKAFEIALRRVGQNPQALGFAPENEYMERDVRQVLFKTRRGLVYRAVFTVLEEEVLVLRVRGPGQPPLGEDEMPIR